MRTNIEIDEKLMASVKRLSKSKTKREVVDLALRNFLATLRRKEMLGLRGLVKWEGNLDEMRG